MSPEPTPNRRSVWTCLRLNRVTRNLDLTWPNRCSSRPAAGRVSANVQPWPSDKQLPRGRRDGGQALIPPGPVDGCWRAADDDPHPMEDTPRPPASPWLIFGSVPTRLQIGL